jgi:uncharacterized protein (DUF433 family)
MPTQTAPHVWLDERGVAWVDESNTKVREIVLDVIAHGWGPKEIHLNHPHLSLGQIHAALAFYYDHKAQLDREIEESLKRTEELKAAAGESPIRKRLKGLGKLK